ncbi:hypothetical protein QIH36_27355, partial [Klebsiella pneumoniae]|nr:hypothetical protein [Klebsiella pneumoniae]
AGCEDGIHLDHFEIQAGLPAFAQKRECFCVPPLGRPQATEHMIDICARVSVIQDLSAPAGVFRHGFRAVEVAEFNQGV